MKTIILSTLLAALCLTPALQAQTTPTTPPDDLQQSLLATTQGLYTAYQQMDQGTFLSVVAPNFLFVSRQGIFDAEGLAGAVQSCTLKTFKLSAPRARLLSPTSALLLFKVHQEASCMGKPEPADFYVTDAFIRKGDTWLISVHTESFPTL
jgi:hypothetical protein